jgi:hypothetical protein
MSDVLLHFMQRVAARELNRVMRLFIPARGDIQSVESDQCTGKA